MISMNKLLIAIVLCIFIRTTIEIFLLKLNFSYSARKSNELPEYLKNYFNSEILKTTIDYLRDRTKVGIAELIFNAFLLIIILLSGIPGLVFNSKFADSLTSPITRAIFLFFCIQVLSIFSMPFELYREFVIEKKFGFSTMTAKLWIEDFIKTLLISALISIPVLTIFIYFFEKYEKTWIIIFWLIFILIQLFLMFIAPRVILPLFNKFEKLPEGELKSEIFKLSEKANFPIASIEVMDESKRSKHSNAFFTGIGKNRKIVLFDTLIRQMSVKEIVAIVAHEIGHYKMAHLIKGFLLSACMSLISFFAVDYLFRSYEFFAIFGIKTTRAETGIFILFILSHDIGFWFSALLNKIHRSWEYAADRYAVRLTGDPTYLKTALIKLTSENRSNLFPHPVFSKIYYSHPPLVERIEALESAPTSANE